MGNCVQKKKFLVKNETDFQIFFKVTENKLNLDVEDIRPGKVGETKRSVKKIIGKKVFKKIEKSIDLATGDSEKRELMEQRDRVVMDINPEERGFKAVFPGQCYRSEKLQQKITSGKLLFLTILTRQFLIQDSLSLDPTAQSRIDDFPVGRNSYNVPLYNIRLKNLEETRGLTVENIRGPDFQKLAVKEIENK